jgi:hypothetical protein
MTIESGELAIQHDRVRQTVNLVSAYVTKNPVSQAGERSPAFCFCSATIRCWSARSR